MASSQVQYLLRFLSQDAKVPLATAMGKIIDLQKSGLTTVQQISTAESKTLQEIFKDEKMAKQVLNAAKRVSKKRAAPSETAESPQKKTKVPKILGECTPFERESALELPMSSASEEELSGIVLYTNRAPLVLAFAVCVLRYTMPEQPISSRLSLAQALVSANSRSKAVSLGIESGASAEQEGWGEGQPMIKVLGREIKVLKRWGYDSREGKPAEGGEFQGDSDSNEALDNTLGQRFTDNSECEPPLWGIDLEALRNTDRNSSTGKSKPDKSLPIFMPESARLYLLKAFTEAPKGGKEPPSKPTRKTVSQIEAQRGAYLGYILRSIDVVCRSWASTLSSDELDRRAWAWYLRVRPEVRSGAGGWGEKGLVKLSDVLDLRREAK
ncbi:hypothetical protein FE257_006847 [Aspergillus nanangensis]|uniref:Impact N-terminal domain-containing protein n=1 Tax=Aspergillus nanangensis TaxID=2582783 RepID=A0AAD4CPE7_ASPNN|nr:hypothetical protein FE257_006847 [Aspergillus nanangensis]